MSSKRRRAAAQASTATQEPVTAPAVTEVESNVAVVQTAAAAPASIRKTVNSMLLEGKSTAEITAVIQERFPTSRAAALPSKHISFYRSLLKKAQAKAEPVAVGAAAE